MVNCVGTINYFGLIYDKYLHWIHIYTEKIDFQIRIVWLWLFFYVKIVFTF
jgi:hypothetical protein